MKKGSFTLPSTPSHQAVLYPYSPCWTQGFKSHAKARKRVPRCGEGCFHALPFVEFKLVLPRFSGYHGKRWGGRDRTVEYVSHKTEVK